LQVKHEIAVFLLFYAVMNRLGGRASTEFVPRRGKSGVRHCLSVVCFLQSTSTSVAATCYCR